MFDKVTLIDGSGDAIETQFSIEKGVISSLSKTKKGWSNDIIEVYKLFKPR